MNSNEFDPKMDITHNKITVFGKKGCMQCKMTASIFTDNDIDFDYIDIEDVVGWREHFKSLGYQGLPVVAMGNDVLWVGFQPERINDIVDAGLWGKPNPQWMKRNKIKDGEIR